VNDVINVNDVCCIAKNLLKRSQAIAELLNEFLDISRKFAEDNSNQKLFERTKGIKNILNTTLKKMGCLDKMIG
jgi:hypothetical protein